MIISLILGLYLLGMVSQKTAYTFLYVSGILLIVGETVFTTYGLIGANGFFALFIAYAIQSGDHTLFGIPVDWSLVFGLAFVEMLIILFSAIIVIRYRKIKATTGREAMVGGKATIISWKGKNGIVMIEGETWKAESHTPMELHKNEQVTVSAVDGLTLKITV